MRTLAAVPLVVLFTLGCQAEKRVASPEYEVQQVRFVPPAANEAPDVEAPPLAPVRRLIRTVDLDLRVDDTEATAEEVRRLTEAAGGYVSRVDAYRVEELLHYRITVRVPVDELDAVVQRLKALAVEVRREQLRTEDVTEKFVDLEARLRTLRLTESELQALLTDARESGSKADEIMAIYRHLTEIRTQIEQLQGQLDALDGLTTFSTVNLELTPTAAARPLVADGWRPLQTVRGSVRALLGALETIGDLVIILVIVVLPVALLLTAVGWLAWKGLRRLRGRRAQ